MVLRDIVEEIAAGVELELEKLSDHAPDAIGQVCDDISSGFRTLAGCALLLDADTDSYYHGLANCGAARVYFLNRSQREQPDLRNAYRATGNSGPLFSTLAARHFDLARKIVALSSKTFWEGEEYAEDFCFAHFFHLLIVDPRAGQTEVKTALTDLGAAIGEDAPARFQVCRSLWDRDQQAFNEAFEALLDERNKELAEMGDPYTPYDAAAHRVARTFFIDGLAILNVADLLGLSTEREFRFCPAAARLPMIAPFPPPPPPLWP